MRCKFSGAATYLLHCGLSNWKCVGGRRRWERSVVQSATIRVMPDWRQMSAWAMLRLLRLCLAKRKGLSESFRILHQSFLQHLLWKEKLIAWPHLYKDHIISLCVDFAWFSFFLFFVFFFVWKGLSFKDMFQDNTWLSNALCLDCRGFKGVQR